MAIIDNPRGWAQPRIQIVGTNGVVPWGVQTVTTQTQTISRIPVVMGGDCSKIILALDNWYINSTGGVTNPGHTLTITGLGFESDALGTTVQVRFSSSLSITLANGALNTQTDAILPSSFGLSKFSRDEVYWVRLTATIPGAGDFAQGTSTAYGNGAKAYYYDPANDINQVYLTGALQAPSGATTSNFAYGPSAVLGQFIAPVGNRSIIGLGDSGMVGIGDVTSIPIAGPGFACRALLTNGSPVNTLPMMKMARSSTNASQYKTNFNVQSYFKYGNILLDELGAADIVDGDSPATVMANERVIWSNFLAMGGQKIIHTNLWPRTSSTDTWETTVNQTPVSGWGAGGSASQLQTLFNNALGGAISGLVPATSLQSICDSYCWVSNGPDCNTAGTPSWGTIDGFHPASVLAAPLGVDARTTLLATSVI